MLESKKYTVTTALKLVLTDPLYLFLGTSLGINLLGLYYFIFLQSTTLNVFFASNNSFYNWTFIGLTLINAVLFGIATSALIFILRRNLTTTKTATGNSLLGAAFGAISSGCPVCGAWLLPILGIAGSLAAFPLQGLEIKILSILLLGFSIHQSAQSILGTCKAPKEKFFTWDKNSFSFDLNISAWSQIKPWLLGGVAILLLYLLPKLPIQYKLNFAGQGITNNNRINLIQKETVNSQTLLEQVNPREGFTLNVKYNDLGPKILKSGAIDLEKFKKIYEQANSPLTDEQLTILTKGLDQKITINQENSYFLINFFWALGLANKNPLLTEGPIAQYGDGQIGSFASTGGWSIAQKDLMDFYSRAEIIKLTPTQQAQVEEVAGNTYRPCCGNPTSFPDCNHGMALLAVFELMAANNASLEEMYGAAKYFNAFWFPQQYLDLATYFKAKEGKDFKDVDAKIILSSEFSSGQGWSKTREWLAQNNLIEKTPDGGGGCGV